ncbi:Oidioi.mRNA.OKI2018_I69.XSR.g16631.t1.cds [Oikopleura dioica]|uniref:Oidioi.mRNA.OKI2018_I69.XSR.g16631.t1.cds n=1 Tax=Oikopleura dioica TaxID=34765 RepID=A0ABN7SKN3_OIKDI|nr:Oidioi.mRNA.OKI2018_I69.XSR.g16631.t1.cds [Oikopleura dioica]
MWVVSYFCIFRGTKSTGKSVYVTSTFPLVMMMILIVRGVTLKGAAKGLAFYLKPNFPKLLEINVWIDAGTQVFFSYMIGIGTAIALGSYNDFHFNSFKWSLFLCGFNASASFFSGFAIFSILGYMSTLTGIDVADIAESGPGLAFIVYPRAVSLMPLPNLWAILFFTMLLMLGLASHYVGVDGLAAMIADLYPKQFKTSSTGRPILVGCICLLCFLVGLPMMTDGGIYVFQIFDIYGASGLCLLWVAFFQTSVVAWIHGRDNYYKKLSLMYSKEINVFRYPWYIFGYLWQFITPIVCMLVFVIKLTQMGRTVYDKTYLYPAWADAFGVCLASSSMIAIPTVFILEYLRSNGGSFIAAYNREVSFLENIQDPEFYSKLSTAASNKWKDVITERISAETKAIISGLEKEETTEEKNISSKDDFLIES